MRRFAILTYGIVSYLAFFGVFLYAIGFVGDAVVPKTVDSGPAAPLGRALIVNLGLLTLFALQHSGMARPAFKRWLTRAVPAPAERSTYVLASSAAMVLLFAFWEPIPALVWDVQAPVARVALDALYLGGWALVLYATTLIDHFDLFGLRQVFLHFGQRPYRGKAFMTPSLYGVIRHPLYVGWLTVFWATPSMTAGHLLLAAVVTGYILVAIQLEERDLLAQLGDGYARWRESTPMFVPRLGRRRAPRRVAEAR
jgi:protein-S-isoprenylcysteine O-methyltransferase Ste14